MAMALLVGRAHLLRCEGWRRARVRQAGQCFSQELGGIRPREGERLVPPTARPDVEDIVGRLPHPLLMALKGRAAA